MGCWCLFDPAPDLHHLIQQLTRSASCSLPIGIQGGVMNTRPSPCQQDPAGSWKLSPPFNHHFFGDGLDIIIQNPVPAVGSGKLFTGGVSIDTDNPLRNHTNQFEGLFQPSHASKHFNHQEVISRGSLQSIFGITQAMATLMAPFAETRALARSSSFFWSISGKHCSRRRMSLVDPMLRQQTAQQQQFITGQVIQVPTTPWIRHLPIQMIEGASQRAAELDRVHVLWDQCLQLLWIGSDPRRLKQVDGGSEDTSSELCVRANQSSGAIHFSPQGGPAQSSFCCLLWVSPNVPKFKDSSQLQLVIRRLSFILPHVTLCHDLERVPVVNIPRVVCPWSVKWKSWEGISQSNRMLDAHSSLSSHHFQTALNEVHDVWPPHWRGLNSWVAGLLAGICESPSCRLLAEDEVASPLRSWAVDVETMALVLPIAHHHFILKDNHLSPERTVPHFLARAPRGLSLETIWGDDVDYQPKCPEEGPILPLLPSLVHTESTIPDGLIFVAQSLVWILTL